MGAARFMRRGEGRTRRGLLAVSFGLGLLGGGAGCNWTKFQDQAEHAPVRSISAPSGYDSADFGKSITPLSNGQGKAAAFIASSTNETHLALIKIDVHGDVTSDVVPGSSLTEVGGSAITSVAEVPGSVPTRLLLGTPFVKNETFGRGYTFDLPDPSSGAGLGSSSAVTYLTTLGSVDSGMGRGAASGFLGGAPGTADYVFGSDNNLAIALDGVTTPASPTGMMSVGACDVRYDNRQENRYVVRRPMLVAPLWNDPAMPGQQLIIGVTSGGAANGSVEIMNVSAGGVLGCVTTILGAKPQFGHSLVAGDFDGDGSVDLAIGAPTQQVMVYRNWAQLPYGTVPADPITITQAGGIDFGYAMAALNIDGVPGDELLVSDPRATVNGTTTAGHVLAFKYNASTGTMDQVKELFDLSPEAEANFGYSLNVLSFCKDDVAGAACPAASQARILLVGASNEVFAFFRVGDNVARDGQELADVRLP